MITISIGFTSDVVRRIKEAVEYAATKSEVKAVVTDYDNIVFDSADSVIASFINTGYLLSLAPLSRYIASQNYGENITIILNMPPQFDVTLADRIKYLVIEFIGLYAAAQWMGICSEPAFYKLFSEQAQAQLIELSNVLSYRNPPARVS